VPVLLGLAALVGLLMALTGLGLGIAAPAVRQRKQAVVPPPWAVQM
jgi:signal peptidase I